MVIQPINLNIQLTVIKSLHFWECIEVTSQFLSS